MKSNKDDIKPKITIFNNEIIIDDNIDEYSNKINNNDYKKLIIKKCPTDYSKKNENNHNIDYIMQNSTNFNFIKSKKEEKFNKNINLNENDKRNASEKDIKIGDNDNYNKNSYISRNKKFNKKNKQQQQQQKTIYFRNIGQYLYEKGLKFKSNKEKKILLMKTENSRNLQKFNFTPKLSKYPRYINNKNKNNIKIEDRLIALGKEQEKKILKLANQKKNLELELFKKNYTYKPQITKMAKNMTKEKYDNIISKYNAKILQKKLLTKTKDNNSKSHDNINNINNININNNNIKKIINKEQINPNKLNQSEISKNDNEEDKLYKMEKQKEKFLENNAEKIILKIKEYKIKTIFDSLDIKKLGYLSHYNLSYINLEPKIIEGIFPVIEEINRDKYKKIFFDEFKNLIHKSLSNCIMKDIL